MTKEEIIAKHLNNENILWQGKPENIPVLNKWDFLLIPLSVAFGSILIMYAIIGAIAMFTGNGAMFALIGITALIIGIYILFLRLWYRKKRVSKQLYFVTDKRVLAFDTMRDDVIFDISLSDVDMSLAYKSLALGEINSIGDFIYNFGLDIFFRKFIKETPTFHYINDISDVSKIIISSIKEEDTDDDSLFI